MPGRARRIKCSPGDFHSCHLAADLGFWGLRRCKVRSASGISHFHPRGMALPERRARLPLARVAPPARVCDLTPARASLSDLLGRLPPVRVALRARSRRLTPPQGRVSEVLASIVSGVRQLLRARSSAHTAGNGARRSPSPPYARDNGAPRPGARTDTDDSRFSRSLLQGTQAVSRQIGAALSPPSTRSAPRTAAHTVSVRSTSGPRDTR